MRKEFWNAFPPIPGLDCVEMKRRAQLRVYEETKGMTPKQIVEYFATRAKERAGRVGRETVVRP
jgi:hypothetical protein